MIMKYHTSNLAGIVKSSHSPWNIEYVTILYPRRQPEISLEKLLKFWLLVSTSAKFSPFCLDWMANFPVAVASQVFFYAIADK